MTGGTISCQTPQNAPNYAESPFSADPCKVDNQGLEREGGVARWGGGGLQDASSPVHYEFRYKVVL
jgi:hypothetical protein